MSENKRNSGFRASLSAAIYASSDGMGFREQRINILNPPPLELHSWAGSSRLVRAKSSSGLQLRISVRKFARSSRQMPSVISKTGATGKPTVGMAKDLVENVENHISTFFQTATFQSDNSSGRNNDDEILKQDEAGR